MIIFEEKNGTVVPMNIETKLLKERIILLNGEIDNEMSSKIISELLCLDSMSNDDIKIYINSPGGSVNDGLAIYDTMNFIKSDVSTICVGEASSMGAIILMNGAKGKRFCLKNSEIMIHQPLGGVSGQATEIDIEAKRIMKTKKLLNEIISSKTNKNMKQVEKDVERDYFMNSTEALKYGIIDKIL